MTSKMRSFRIAGTGSRKSSRRRRQTWSWTSCAGRVERQVPTSVADEFVGPWRAAQRLNHATGKTFVFQQIVLGDQRPTSAIRRPAESKNESEVAGAARVTRSPGDGTTPGTRTAKSPETA